MKLTNQLSAKIATLESQALALDYLRAGLTAAQQKRAELDAAILELTQEIETAEEATRVLERMQAAFEQALTVEGATSIGVPMDPPVVDDQDDEPEPAGILSVHFQGYEALAEGLERVRAEPSLTEQLITHYDATPTEDDQDEDVTYDPSLPLKPRMRLWFESNPDRVASAEVIAQELNANHNSVVTYLPQLVREGVAEVVTPGNRRGVSGTYRSARAGEPVAEVEPQPKPVAERPEQPTTQAQEPTTQAPVALTPASLSDQEETLLRFMLRNFPNGASAGLIAGRLKWRSTVVERVMGDLAQLGFVTRDGARFVPTEKGRAA